MVGSSSNKGKFGKVRRGGGRHFTSARDLKGGNGEEGIWGARSKAASDDEEESEEESEEEEESDDSNGASHRSPYDNLANREPQGKPKLDKDGEIMRDKLGNVVFEEPEPSARPAGDIEISRAERKALKAKLAAAKKNKASNANTPAALPNDSEEESADERLAPVDNRASGKSVKISDLGKEPQELSRREREEKQKKEAKERYQKMHAAGKTDEAKADIARLRKIREQREQAAAVRKAEQEVKDKEAKDTLEASGRRKAR